MSQGLFSCVAVVPLTTRAHLKPCDKGIPRVVAAARQRRPRESWTSDVPVLGKDTPRNVALPVGFSRNPLHVATGASAPPVDVPELTAPRDEEFLDGSFAELVRRGGGGMEAFEQERLNIVGGIGENGMESLELERRNIVGSIGRSRDEVLGVVLATLNPLGHFPTVQREVLLNSGEVDFEDEQLTLQRNELVSTIGDSSNHSPHVSTEGDSSCHSPHQHAESQKVSPCSPKRLSLLDDRVRWEEEKGRLSGMQSKYRRRDRGYTAVSRALTFCLRRADSVADVESVVAGAEGRLTQATISSCLSRLGLEGNTSAAVALLQWMRQQEGVTGQSTSSSGGGDLLLPNVFTYNSTLGALRVNKDWARMDDVLTWMEEDDVAMDVVTLNVLLLSYVDRGMYGEAWDFLGEAMAEEGIVPDLFTLRALAPSILKSLDSLHTMKTERVEGGKNEVVTKEKLVEAVERVVLLLNLFKQASLELKTSASQLSKSRQSSATSEQRALPLEKEMSQDGGKGFESLLITEPGDEPFGKSEPEGAISSDLGPDSNDHEVLHLGNNESASQSSSEVSERARGTRAMARLRQQQPEVEVCLRYTCNEMLKGLLLYHQPLAQRQQVEKRKWRRTPVPETSVSLRDAERGSQSKGEADDSMGSVEGAKKDNRRKKHTGLECGAVEALTLLEMMKTCGISPDGATYYWVLRVLCLDAETHQKRLRALHLEMRSKRYLPDVSLCNSIIAALGSAKKWWAALEVYEEMQKWGPQSTEETRALVVGQFVFLLDAGRRRRLWKWSLQLLGRMKGVGLEPDRRCWCTVLVTCAAANESEAAVKVFKEMVEAGHKADVVAYGALLSALEKGRQWGQAAEVWEHMTRVGVRPNVQAYTTMVTVLGQQGQYSKAVQLFEEMQRGEGGGVKPDIPAYNALISACAVAGEGMRALDWIQKLEKKGLNATSYEQAALALCNEGQWEAAKTLISNVNLEGFAARPKCVDILQICKEHEVPEGQDHLDVTCASPTTSIPLITSAVALPEATSLAV